MALAACTVGWMSSVHADTIEPVTAAFHATKPIVDVRLRSEQVEQDGLPEDADALTLRARLGFETGKAWNWSLLAEAELLWPLVTDYNSTVNGKTQFPIVADPESYEINRLALVNTSLPGTTLTFGRQLILQDNQRFVSPADWRQNEQSFDALRVLNQSVSNLTIDLSYVNQVNRVFGKESPQGRYTGDNYLANVAYQAAVGRFAGFAYLLDLEQAPTDSSTTIGLRYTGEWTLSEIKLEGAATFARQEDRGNNPLSFSDD
jgi:alginate export protein